MSSYTPASNRYEAGRYARCGRSGLKLPRLSLGLWHNFGHVDALENQRALLRRAFDLGCTHFDLTPGNYLLVCFLPDAKDGKPHLAHGMIKEFAVS